MCQNLEEMELRGRTNATSVRGDSPPNFHRFQFSESWSSPKILKKKSTIRFNAESSNVELLFRIIHSASQLSGCGAVSSWSGQHSLAGAEPTSESFVESEETIDKEKAKSMKPEEVNFSGWFCEVLVSLETGRRMTLMTLDWWKSHIGLQDFPKLQHSWRRHVLQNTSRHGWCFWRSHACLQRIFPTSTRRRITSSRCLPEGTVIGPLQHFVTAEFIELNFVLRPDKGNQPGSWCFEDTLDTWTKHLFQCLITTSQARNWLRKRQSKKQNFVLEIEEILRWGNSWLQTVRIFRQCATFKALFPSKKGSGSLFVKVYGNLDNLKPSSQSSCQCYHDTVIKKNEIQTELHIGIHSKLMNQFGTRVEKN